MRARHPAKFLRGGFRRAMADKLETVDWCNRPSEIIMNEARGRLVE